MQLVPNFALCTHTYTPFYSDEAFFCAKWTWLKFWKTLWISPGTPVLCHSLDSVSLLLKGQIPFTWWCKARCHLFPCLGAFLHFSGAIFLQMAYQRFSPGTVAFLGRTQVPAVKIINISTLCDLFWMQVFSDLRKLAFLLFHKYFCVCLFYARYYCRTGNTAGNLTKPWPSWSFSLQEEEFLNKEWCT